MTPLPATNINVGSYKASYIVRRPLFQHGVCLDNKLLCDYENEKKDILGYYSVLIPISYACNLDNFSVLRKMQRTHQKNIISHSYAQFSKRKHIEECITSNEYHIHDCFSPFFNNFSVNLTSFLPKSDRFPPTMLRFIISLLFFFIII